MSSARSIPHGRELVEQCAGPARGYDRSRLAGAIAAQSPPYLRRRGRRTRPSRRGRGRGGASRVAVALLPVADEVGVERRRPRHAALEEPEVEVGEAAGDAAEEQRLGQRVVALAEHADVVVHVARDRRAGSASPWPPSGTPARRRARGTSARPGRSRTRCRGRRCRSTPRTARARGSTVGGRGDRPLHEAGHHHGPEAERPPRARARRPLRRACASGSRRPGSSRSANSANTPALKRLSARHAPRRSRSSSKWPKSEPEARVDHADVDARARAAARGGGGGASRWRGRPRAPCRRCPTGRGRPDGRRVPRA